MKSTRVAAFLAFGLCALLFASTATAAFNGDTNQFTFNVVNGVPSGGGDWYEYPQPGANSWWNIWFENAGAIEGEKFIWYDITLDKFTPSDDPVRVEVAINWTTDGWTDPIDPPTWDNDANPEDYIVRQTVFRSVIDNPVTITSGGPEDALSFPIHIPEWNPLWVSLDVRTITGEGWKGEVTLWHEHVPEPSSFVIMAGLLTLGGIMFVRRRKAA